MEEHEREERVARQRAAEERGSHFLHPIMGRFWRAGFETYDAGPWRVLAGKYVLDVTPEDGESVDDVFDRLVKTHLSEEMVQATRRALSLPPGITVSWVDGAVELRGTGDEALCRIEPSSATVIDSGARIPGNFLSPWGTHWSRLIDAVANPGTRYRLPGSVAKQMPELAEMSMRLRRQRAVAYPVDVTLLAETVNLTLSPVSIVRGGGHELPVRVVGPAGELLDGYLALEPGSGVLDLIAYELEPVSFLLTARTIAVFGAAELLCVERIPEPEPSQQRRQRRGQSATPRPPRDLEERRFVFGRFLHSSNLTPTADTLALAGHYVVGHRRELRPGQSASDRARANAAQVGITLRARETWVKPHTRGLSDAATLSFLWDTRSIPVLPDSGDSPGDSS